MISGQHLVLVARGPEAALWGQDHGLEHRDTLKILMPGPTCLLAFLFRVPLQESTVAAQVLANGQGGIWIDGCRTRTTESLNGGAYAKDGSDRHDGAENWRYKRLGGAGDFKQPAGRWPTNLLLVHHPECVQEGIRSVRGTNVPGEAQDSKTVRTAYGAMGGHRANHYADQDGLETVASWQCHPTCPVWLLDRQSGVTLSTGGRNRNITPSGVYGAGKGLGSSSPGMTAEEVRGDPGFGDRGGASRYYPQFGNLGECLDWLQRLINGPGPV